MLDGLGALGSIKAPTGTLEFGNVGQTDCVFLRLVGGPGTAPYLIYTAEELVDLIAILSFADKLGQGTQPGTILRLGALRPKPIVLRLALVHPNQGDPFVLLRLCQGRNKIDIPVQISSAIELFRQGQTPAPAPPVCGTLRRDPGGAWIVGGQELTLVPGHSPGTGVYGEYLHPDEVPDGEDLVIWTFPAGGKQWIGAFRSLQQWQAPKIAAHPMAQEGDVAMFHGETYRCRQILKTFAHQQAQQGEIEPIWAAKIALSSLLCDIVNGEDEAGHRTWLGNSDDPILRLGIEAIESGHTSSHDLAIYEQVSCYFHSLGADREAAVQAVNQIMERLFREVPESDKRMQRLLLHNWAYLLKEIFEGKPGASVAAVWKTCKDRYPGRIVPKALCFPPPHAWIVDWLDEEPEADPAYAEETEQEEVGSLFPDEEPEGTLFPEEEGIAPPPIEAMRPASPTPPPTTEVELEAFEDPAIELDSEEPYPPADRELPGAPAEEPGEDDRPPVRVVQKKSRSKAPLLIGLIVLLGAGGAGWQYLRGSTAPQPSATPSPGAASPVVTATPPPVAATSSPAVTGSPVASDSPLASVSPAPSGTPAATPTTGSTAAPPPINLGALSSPNVGGLDPEARYSVDRAIAGMKMLEQGPGWGSYEKDGYQVILGARQTGTIKSTKAKSFASQALFDGGKKVLEAGIKVDQIPQTTQDSLVANGIKLVTNEAEQTVLGFRSGEDFPESTVAPGQPLGASLLKAYEAKDLAGFKAALNKENANLLYMDGDSLLAKLAKQAYAAEYFQAVLDMGADAKGPGALKAYWATSDPAIVTALIKAGLSPDVTDPDGKTKLFGATAEMVKALLEGKADPNIQDSSGATALFSANPEAVTALLKGGANPNLADNEGKTALMGADLEKTRALLAGGADPKLKDKAGKTALDYAAGDAAVQALLKKPAKPAKPGK